MWGERVTRAFIHSDSFRVCVWSRIPVGGHEATKPFESVIPVLAHRGSPMTKL